MDLNTPLAPIPIRRTGYVDVLNAETRGVVGKWRNPLKGETIMVPHTPYTIVGV